MKAVIIACMMFYLLVGTISVAGNFVVLFVVYKSKQLRHSQYVYKCSIAISDIICGFSISAQYMLYFLWVLNVNEVILLKDSKSTKPIVTKEKNNITNYTYEIQEIALTTNFYSEIYNWFSTKINFVVYYVTPITLFVSFVSLVFASIDRYIALRFPFRYRQINSIKIAKLVSVFVWFLSAIFQTVTSFLFYHHSYPSHLLQPTIFSVSKISLNQHITATILIILFFLLWVLTFLTLCSLYKSYKRSVALRKKAKNIFSQEKQMAFVLISMVVGFSFSLAPTIYFHICSYFCKMEFSQRSLFVSIALLATNSVWNFIIYNISNKTFRSALIKVFFEYK